MKKLFFIVFVLFAANVRARSDVKSVVQVNNKANIMVEIKVMYKGDCRPEEVEVRGNSVQNIQSSCPVRLVQYRGLYQRFWANAPISRTIVDRILGQHTYEINFERPSRPSSSKEKGKREKGKRFF